MFELTVWVCFLSGGCAYPIDLSGPHETKEQCIERALEMSDELRPTIIGNHTFAFNCSREK